MTFIQKQFTIEAPQNRVWELLGRGIYRCLPLEKMDIINETTFRAVLKWKLSLINIPLNVRVVLEDIFPPSLLGALIQVKKGIIDQTMKVAFSLNEVDEGKTEVICTATGKGGAILGGLLRRQQRSFTEGMFDSIKARLERFC